MRHRHDTQAWKNMKHADKKYITGDTEHLCEKNSTSSSKYNKRDQKELKMQGHRSSP